MKVARLVSCKVTLAARIDSCHESPHGQQGKALLSEIEKRVEKLTEPPPVKAVKPLPAPIDSGRKKRGGRRHRKMKERLGMTELRSGANKTAFGTVRISVRMFRNDNFLFFFFQIEEDAYQEDLGFSAGLIGKSGSGKVRAAQVDSKTKARISQKLQVRFSSLLILSKSTFDFLRKLYNNKTTHMEEQQQFTIENKSVVLHRVWHLLHFK